MSNLKEEKTMNDSSQNKYDELYKENNKTDLSFNELQKKYSIQNGTIEKNKNKLSLLKQNIKDKDNKIDILKTENDKININYKKLMGEYQIYSAFFNNFQNQKDDLLKKLDDKYKYLIDSSLDDLITLIIEKDKNILLIAEENKSNKSKCSELTKKNKQIENELNKYEDLKNKYNELQKKYQNLLTTEENLKKENEDYKNKHDKLLQSISEQNKINKKSFDIVTKVHTSQLEFNKLIKKKPKTAITDKNDKKIFDYLCLKMDAEIIQNLDDTYFNPNSNLVFTELINYVDDKKLTECVLFITPENCYLFNEKHEKFYKAPLSLLTHINVSNKNNFVSLVFDQYEMLSFELFRILEIVDFFKILQTKNKKNYKYKIIIQPYTNNFKTSYNKNFTECLYYGKAIFSGRLERYKSGMIYSSKEKIFGVLSEIGLILLDSPVGQPLEIINLLFAEIKSLSDDYGYWLIIIIGKNKHSFVFDSLTLRTQWQKEIEKYKESNYDGKQI